MLLTPCVDEENCTECAKDEKRYKELIDILSRLHIYNSRDPKVLCAATFKEFRSDSPDYSKYSQMVGELFEIASKHKEEWTMINKTQ